MPKKILITGGAGYIGSALIQNLVAKDYIITALGSLLRVPTTKNYNDNVSYIEGDIRSQKLAEIAVKECEILVHLANISESWPYLISEELYESINYKAFLSMLEAAKKSGIEKFIFISSMLVYGNQNARIITENEPPNPISHYGKYKVACEKELTNNKWPFAVTILRPPSVCGYSPRMRFDLPHNALIRDSYFRKELRIPWTNSVRPTIHINDLAEIIALLISETDNIKIDKQIFNAGYENLTWMQWAEKMKELTDENLKISYTQSTLNYSHAISTEKIERILGFRPKNSFTNAYVQIVSKFQDKTIINPYEDIYYNGKLIKINNIR